MSDTIDGRLGGGVVAGRNVVDALRRQGHDVRVLAADATDPRDVRLPGFQLPIRAMRQMQFMMARPDRSALARAFAEADVVHVQFPFWLGLVAVEEAIAAGKPVVTAFHIQPENALLNVGIGSPRLNEAIYRLWVKRFFNRADAVVCPTPFAERKLRAHGLTAPSHVVSNGVPPDIGAASILREPAHEDKFLILAVGRFAAEKRQDVLLEAVRRSRHRDRIRLVIAGSGPKEAELRALGARLPHPPEIGFLPRERLARLLSTADLFVHPSDVELEGIAVLEAMSKRLPVLVAASEESAASDLVASDEFRFPSGDAAALAAKIDDLVEHPERLLEAGARNRASVRSLTFDASVAKLVSIYRSATGIPAERASREAAIAAQ